jgi:hypothetical protein
VALAGWVGSLGCREAKVDSYAVHGRVEWNGQPLPSGLIRFNSDDGMRGAQGEIQNGEFHVESSGLTAGNYKVAIESYQPTGRKIRDADAPSQAIDELKQFIPAKYNTQTELLQQLPVTEDQPIIFSLKSS